MVHTADDLKGIHYAIDRNDMHPDTYLYGLHQAWNCENPSCNIDYDTRFHALHLRFKWAQLNPTRGVYNWVELDAFLDEAVTYGKKVTIVVMGGQYTPQFVIDEGCVTVDAEYKGGQFTISTPPLPQDHIYRDNYNTFIRAMAAHITGDVDYNNAVVLVKSGLAVAHSGETRILPLDPYRFPDWVDEEDGDAQRDYLATRFCEAGYQGDMTKEAIRESCDVIKEVFPDQFVGIAYVHGAVRFPTNGTGVAPDLTYSRNLLAESLVAVAEDHGSRFVGNNTYLVESMGPAAETLCADIEAEGGIIGWQLEAAAYGYRNAENPNDPTGIQNCFVEGRSLNGIFVEVHDGNMDPHASLLITENALLRS